jgi:hypothetical protein
MDELRPWHQLFALSWLDFFRGLPVTVEAEKDLSVKKQLLDVLVIHKEAATLDCRLPDGFEGLGTYNLITFKSHQEKLSDWTLLEVVGHYVNLRKQVSPSMDEDQLLPEDDFRLYAVCARYPQQLVSRNVLLQPVGEGVYEVQVLTRCVRVIVANQLPRREHNAMLHVFASTAEVLTYGIQHYQIRSAETTTLLTMLFRRYREEGRIMPDMLEQFARETIDMLLKELPVEKRLAGLSPKERVEGLSPKERVEGLSPKERVEGLSAEELIKILPSETLRALADHLKGNGGSAKPE